MTITRLLTNKARYHPFRRCSPVGGGPVHCSVAHPQEVGGDGGLDEAVEALEPVLAAIRERGIEWLRIWTRDHQTEAPSSDAKLTMPDLREGDLGTTCGVLVAVQQDIGRTGVHRLAWLQGWPSNGSTSEVAPTSRGAESSSHESERHSKLSRKGWD